MNKLPSRIVIAGKVWEVDYRWRLEDDNGKHCTSYADWANRIIWLDRAADRPDKLHALLTELITIALDSGDPAKTLLETFKLTFRSETHNAVRRANERR